MDFLRVMAVLIEYPALALVPAALFLYLFSAVEIAIGARHRNVVAGVSASTNTE